MIVLEILGVGAAMVVALFYFGYGPARVLLPAPFAPYRLLLTPFAGMALVIVWDYIALFFGFDLTRATWALLAAATVWNALVLARRWRLRIPVVSRPFLPREQWLVVGFALVAFVAAIAPLLRYGYATVIGENWDYEFYLPLADYLRAMPIAALANAPPNPLLTTILSRHILPLPMGFTYLHTTLDVLTQRQALDSFAVLLGVLRALGVAAAYLFFRMTFKMRARAAVAAAALVALNGLLLWFTYWSFGLHLAALALSPIALLFGTHALLLSGSSRMETIRAVVAAGFFLGALNVTYHPALVAVALPLAAIGSYQLVRQNRRREIILRGAGMIGLTAAFSFPALFHIPDLLREYYGRAPLAIGLREFVPLSDGYGLSLYLLDLAVGHTIPTPWLYEIAARVWAVGAPLLTLAAVLSSLYALWQLRGDRERRAVWYLVVGASVFYVALFRLPFLRPYPYGFLKSLSLVSYVLLALVVQGIDLGIRKSEVGSRKSEFKFRAFRPGSLVAVSFLALFFLFTLLTFALSVEQYFKPRPAFFDADALKLRELAARIPDDAEVFLTDRAETQKIPMGMAAYALLKNPQRGNVTTGYGELHNAQPGRVYDYALLARGEDPTTRGYQNSAVWANETFALYPRAPGVVAQQALNAQTVPPQSLVLQLGAQEIISGTRVLTDTLSVRDVRIGFASFVPQTVDVSFAGQNARILLQPGLTSYTAAGVTLPATLVVTPTVAPKFFDAANPTIPHQLPGADVTLFVPYLQWTEPRAGANAQADTAVALVRCTNENADGLNGRCFVVNPRAETLKWRWIVRGTPAGTREEQLMAQAETVAAPLERVDVSAMPQGGMSFQLDGAAPQSFSTPALPDGKYRGALEILRGAILLARIPLYTFEIRGNGSEMTRDTGASAPVILAP